MKRTAVVMVFVSLVPGVTAAAVDFEKCVAEEKALRARVADRCGGLSYLFDPSSCFIAQKALLPFTDGQCQRLKREEANAPPGAAAPTDSPPPVDVVKPASSPDAPVSEVARLKGEIVQLKAEVERLRKEIDELKKR